ncbi:MAG: dTDP-4-amino-4,6-dideoxygalactose transaminase [Bacteroidetes bacterium]|nr:dTDP-4-amino-4,6-dideoxygalactose transaminase [Bacteroidota bacterium]
MIPFNKPYLTGKEVHYIYQAVSTGKISGDGLFTKKCHALFEQDFGFRKCLLTTSCTDALEMCALLLNIQPGDEVIMPSYTFVSTANAFVLRGANIVFADSMGDNPNIDATKLESLISPKTKAIVVVHYAGIACDMESIMQIANKHQLFVVEDAAQAIDSYFNGRALGSIGHLAAFSFHETKNIQCGEGGMLVINDERFAKRAEIIREKGTNRSAFFRGEVDKYGWVDIGSSFLPSEITAAFLYAQLENLQDIQQKRKAIWERYFEGLRGLEEAKKIKLPQIPTYATNNAHMFYIVCRSLEDRNGLIAHLKEKQVLSVFHYLSLHRSAFYAERYQGPALKNCDLYSDCLLRLPLYYELSMEDQAGIIKAIQAFYA